MELTLDNKSVVTGAVKYITTTGTTGFPPEPFIAHALELELPTTCDFDVDMKGQLVVDQQDANNGLFNNGSAGNGCAGGLNDCCFLRSMLR